ncbi:MAG: 2-keto-4-pentenoate hydratase [Solirubrobacterales bacterium]
MSEVAGSRRAELAARLREAERSGTPIEPLTRTEPGLTLGDAYAIQTENVGARLAAGDVLVGRKIGLTSKPMQRLLGVAEPDFGALLGGMAVEDGGSIAVDRLLAPRAEAEIAFLIESELAGPGVTGASAAAAIGGAVAAIEIIDSRIADWEIQLVDTVADNASSARFALGSKVVPLDELDLRLEGMALSSGEEVVSTGAGAAALGDPLRCVAWLADALAEFGDGLRPGDVVLSGALHAAVPVTAGETLRGEFTNLGSVAVAFTDSGREA